MNVPTSTALIGSNVSTGLMYLHSQLNSDTLKQNSSYQTTAWFCQILTRWFKLMSSRHFVLSVNEANYEKFETELEDFMEIIRHTKVGDGKWKPFQRGLLLSTKSILEMSKHLLEKRKFNFVLLGRLTQDCLENLFSTVRSGNPKPNALQAKDAIKSISISEYLQRTDANNTSYMWDDADFMKDFLKIVRQAKEMNDESKKEVFENDQQQLNNVTFELTKMHLSRRETNVLYKVACHLLYKISVSEKKLHCSICIGHCRSNGLENKNHTVLMRQPNLQYNCTKSVFYIQDDLYKYFTHMEKAYRLIYPVVSKGNKNLGDLITNKLLDICVDSHIPQCHNLKKTITKVFVAFRLKNSGVVRNRKRKFNFSSNSIN